MTKQQSKAELKASGAKVSTRTDRNEPSAIYTIAFEFGAMDGKGKLAKLSLGLKLQSMAKAKEFDFADTKAQDAVLDEAMKGYVAGTIEGGSPMSVGSAKTFRSELRSFIKPNAVTMSKVGYDLLAKVKGDNLKGDAFQRHTYVNREMNDLAEGKAISLAAVRGAVTKSEDTDDVKAAKARAKFRKEAEALLEGKGVTKAQRDALAAVIAAFPKPKAK